MNTFLTSPDYEETARTLDITRLGNQAYRECRTLINGGWPNHPASKMWQGHWKELCRYALALLFELRDNRGRNYPHHIQFFGEKAQELPDTGPPAWIGDERVHSSHRAVLLRKGLEDETFRRWRGKSINTPGRETPLEIPYYKKDWNDQVMEIIWNNCGRPSLAETWYGRFDWNEYPAERNPDGTWPYYWPV